MRAPIKSSLLFFVAWVIPGVLLMMAMFPELQYGARILTLKKMDALRERAAIYSRQFQSADPSLREVAEYAPRSFPHLKKLSIYDHYGLRFDLLHLDGTRTIVKSWGSIQFSDDEHPFAQGLYSAPSRWPQLFPMVIHSYPNPPALYQPAQLISSTSFDQQYTARLFVNHKTAQRTLVVVRADHYEPILIHRTFNPEEFFWVPGSRILVFSSDPNHSSKGPLHFYDVDHDEIRTITIEGNSLEDHKQESVTRSYMAALAGAKDDKLYAYMMPYEKKPLRPTTLFSVDHLYEIKITYPQGSDHRFRIRASLVQPHLDYVLRAEYLKPKLGRGSHIQRAWFRLKILGKIENNIDHWQRFALKAQDRHSPMLPYALMTLITLYDRVGHLYGSYNKLQGAQLHQYALRYAQLVAEGVSYPTWLNLVAWDILNRIENGEEINLSAITPLSQSVRDP